VDISVDDAEFVGCEHGHAIDRAASHVVSPYRFPRTLALASADTTARSFVSTASMPPGSTQVKSQVVLPVVYQAGRTFERY
jgi:hypothetical protein